MTFEPSVQTPGLPAGDALQPAPRRLSDVLRQLEREMAPRVALGDLTGGLKDRSFAPLLVLFAVPNVFLYLPGASVITGLPLMILSVQLLAGRPAVWLPGALSNRSIERAAFFRIVHYALPWVERMERLAKPRLWPGTPQAADRAAGLACLVMAVLLFLPIPFANALPALAVIAFGLALSERDGLWLIAGLLLSVFAAAFVTAILGGGMLALAAIF